MAKNGKLLLVERVMPDQVDQSVESRGVALGDLHMMVLCGGAQRTKRQFAAMLAAAGFKLTNIIPVRSQGQLSVIEGVPVQP